MFATKELFTKIVEVLGIPLKQHRFQIAQEHGGKNKHKDDAKQQLSPSNALV
jgi:hypothetical protein